jgi:hypothetical protein
LIVIDKDNVLSIFNYANNLSNELYRNIKKLDSGKYYLMAINKDDTISIFI